MWVTQVSHCSYCHCVAVLGFLVVYKQHPCENTTEGKKILAASNCASQGTIFLELENFPIEHQQVPMYPRNAKCDPLICNVTHRYWGLKKRCCHEHVKPHSIPNSEAALLFLLSFITPNVPQELLHQAPARHRSCPSSCGFKTFDKECTGSL